MVKDSVEIVREAEQNARRVIDDAKKEAQRILAEARAEGQRQHEETMSGARAAAEETVEASREDSINAQKEISARFDMELESIRRSAESRREQAVRYVMDSIING